MSYFSLFSDLGAEQAGKWAGLCNNAKSILERRMRDTRREQDYDRLCQAAGGLAYCDYLQFSKSSSASPDEFRVGDISVKNSSGSAGRQDSAELSLMLRDEFMARVADLLEPENIFMAVGGSMAADNTEEG